MDMLMNKFTVRYLKNVFDTKYSVALNFFIYFRKNVQSYKQSVINWNSKGFLFFREFFQMNEWWDRYFKRMCNKSFCCVKLRVHPFSQIRSINTLYINQKKISLHYGSFVFFWLDSKLQIFPFTISPLLKNLLNTSFTDNVWILCLILIPLFYFAMA